MVLSAREVVQHLMFRLPPLDFGSFIDGLRADAVGHTCPDTISQLAEVAVALNSALPIYHLCNTDLYPDTAVMADQLESASTQLLATLEALSSSANQRVRQRIDALSASQLLKLALMGHNGQCNTRWGHDFASGLWDESGEALLYGAILVTTNPVLVGLAAKGNLPYWTPIRDKVREQNPGATAEKIAEIMTIKVVVSNARLLRPIWELNDRKLGLVSLQLSPKDAFDAEVMIEGALRIWEQLICELGGTPNCVFKVPGTKAGIAVAGELTRRGIGVNVTVNYSLPQQIAFAGVIERNSMAPLSFRTQMDGRVDDPIGEELKEAGVPDWEEVKTWATTLIRQQDYRLLCMPPTEGGLGFEKSFCLGASGRGPWNILRSITDGPATLFLTVFPDKQEEFDAEPRVLNPRAIWEPVPASKLDTLLGKSSLFRQSFEPDGMTPDEFDTYLPVQQTLKQFGEGYDDFVAWCGGDDSVYATA